jgi:SAM-dependent methyltransferase
VSSPINVPKPPVSEPSTRRTDSQLPGGAAQNGALAAAYDALAADYDAQLAPAEWVRERLWARLDVLLPAGARVLDVTAGTGLDAIHLAQRGVHVIACDLSPAMLARLHAKEPSIETRVADFNGLPPQAGDGGLDGILSTFAGLNTSPDLRPFARTAARLLRPGGWLFLHMLNRWPTPDLVRHAASLRGRMLWGALTSNRREVELGGIPVPHYLYAPRDLYRRLFAAEFRLERMEAQGLFRPVGAEAHWAQARLDHWERALAHRAPFNALGTFFSLELARL